MDQPAKKTRFLSGVQPSGKLHVGNYFGAIKQHIELQEQGDCFYFIANYHAQTTMRDLAERMSVEQSRKLKAADLLRQHTLDVALDYLALGLDPAKAVFYRQSDVPEVAELTWILSTITNMGLMERAVSYKEKIDKGIEASVGLFTYPVLMAADILIVRSNVVPVGKDQVQHLEMAADIAGKFNRAFEKDIFPIPTYRLDKESKVPGTDGQKMSKSYGNTIDIFAEGKPLEKTVMAIKTDSTPMGQPLNPQTCNVFALYGLFATEAERTALADQYRAGTIGFGGAKKMLKEKIDAYFAPFRDKRKELAARPDTVEDILRDGARQARLETQKTMDKVHKATGLR
ncbi:MAG: tryptophan--tRNA ligase [Planctomycetes bacterium]|nr:tryptophan--tRNA ligase [Planctomycetota bacterium]